MKIRTWLVLLAFAVLLVAAGVFFATQELSVADQYASVASFFLALVVAGASTVGRLRAGRSRTGDAGGTRPASRWRGARVAFGNDQVNQGDHATTYFVKNGNMYNETPGDRPRD
jgi:hypothetical protein